MPDENTVTLLSAGSGAHRLRRARNRSRTHRRSESVVWREV